MGQLFEIQENRIVKFIGDNNNTAIVVPEGIEIIGANAFADCDWIESITLANSTRIVEGGAFWSCKVLKKVVLSDNTNMLGRHCFANCTSLEEVLVNRSSEPIEAIGVIENYSFSDCRELKTLEIPRAIKKIKDAFVNSEKISKLDIYATTNEISTNAFSSKIKINDEDLTIINGVLVGVTNYGPEMKKVVVPAGVTKIGCRAFSLLSYLKEVVLPEGLTEIGTAAFYGSKKLSKINLPSTLSLISAQAFADCTALTEISFADSLSEIWSNAFEGCSRLTQIDFPQSIEFIGSEAFSKCKNLSHITLPRKKIEIDKDAFKGCKLLKIDLPENYLELQDGLPEGLCGYITSASESDVALMSKSKSKKWKQQVELLKVE